MINKKSWTICRLCDTSLPLHPLAALHLLFIFIFLTPSPALAVAPLRSSLNSVAECLCIATDWRDDCRVATPAPAVPPWCGAVVWCRVGGVVWRLARYSGLWHGRGKTGTRPHIQRGQYLNLCSKGKPITALMSTRGVVHCIFLLYCLHYLWSGQNKLEYWASLGFFLFSDIYHMVMFPLRLQKEPEFLDVLESCSLTWLTDGNQSMSESVHRTTEEIHTAQPLHHTSSSSSSSSSCMSPAVAEERQVEADRGRNGDSSTGGSSDLLPPEFFELLSEGGVGTMDSSGAVISSGYYYHHQHHHTSHVQPASPSASEEELPCVPDSPSCSSSASQSPSQNCSPPSSPVSSPSVYLSSRLGKRKRTAGERANSALSSFSSSMQRSPYSSTKKSRKEREQENERKVQELTEQNERLKAEIERLGEEVQRTRRALIERLVNTRKWGGVCVEQNGRWKKNISV